MVWTVRVDPNQTSVGANVGFNALGSKRYLARLPKGKAIASWQSFANEGIFNSFHCLPKIKISSCTPMF